MDDKTNDPKCGDCPDYTRLSSDNSVGYCQAINDYQSSTHPVCPPRRRELEALAEVERLEKENMRLRGELGHMRHRMQLIGGVS